MESGDRHPLVNLSDEELLWKIAEHDAATYEDACDLLFERYFKEISTWFSRRGAENDAEDLALEVLFRVIRGARTFRGEASARTWIFSVKENTRRSYWRACYERWDVECSMLFYTDENGVLREVEAVDRKSVPVSSEKLDTNALLIAAIDSLSGAEKFAIFLIIIKGRSRDEAALIMNISKGALGQSLSRALSNIRNFLSCKLEAWTREILCATTNPEMSSQGKNEPLEMSPQEKNQLLDSLIETMADRIGNRYPREIIEQRTKVMGWMQDIENRIK